MLRAAQNASVVSNASSTSAGHPDGLDNSNHLLSGPNHPIPSHRRHHRTSSSTSTRSITATAGSISTASGIAAPAARRVDSLPQAISLSRQNSTGIHRSGASSPAPLSGSFGHADQFSHFYHQQRPSMLPHRDYSSGNVPTIGSTAGEVGSATSVPTTARYEEAALQRQELENVKRENEALKKKIRELERTLRDRRQSDASLNRPRSESVSTTASVSIGRGRDNLRNKDAEEDESVRVGESARSGGLRWVGMGWFLTIWFLGVREGFIFSDYYKFFDLARGIGENYGVGVGFPTWSDLVCALQGNMGNLRNKPRYNFLKWNYLFI